MRRVPATGSGAERGASLVEFALVVPLLSMFLFGIVQFGIAYDKQQSINSAAREGARIGALETTTMDELATRASDAYDSSAVAGALPKIVVEDDGGTVVAVRCTNGAYRPSDNCSSNPSNSPSAETAEGPCHEDFAGDDPADDNAFVVVTVSTPYEITIPFWGVQTVTIDAEAQFRCE